MKQSLMILVTVSRSDRHIFLSENIPQKQICKTSLLHLGSPRKKKSREED
jgi:hypothetical protein